MTVEIDKDEEGELKLRVFQDRLGYHFRNRDLLINALTHASTGEDKNYERMEFLGDRVLGLVIAEILYRCFPYENEGALARRHSAKPQTFPGSQRLIRSCSSPLRQLWCKACCLGRSRAQPHWPPTFRTVSSIGCSCRPPHEQEF